MVNEASPRLRADPRAGTDGFDCFNGKVQDAKLPAFVNVDPSRTTAFGFEFVGLLCIKHDDWCYPIGAVMVW